MNLKEATILIENEKKQLTSKIDELSQDFELKTGAKISLLQLMRMGNTDSETTVPCTLIMLEI
jgi:hypothetical protein